MKIKKGVLYKKKKNLLPSDLGKLHCLFINTLLCMESVRNITILNLTHKSILNTKNFRGTKANAAETLFDS